MTPQEKAKELYLTFQFPGSFDWTNVNGRIVSRGKECALIAVEEMIDCFDHIGMTNHDSMPYRDHWLKYWNEVKTEIEKL